MTRAACLDADPEVWFPIERAATGPALAICRDCPVQAECLDYALAHDARHGVWGGLTERQVDGLRRKARRTP